MAVIEDPSSGAQANVDTYKALRVVNTPRGRGYAYSGMSGTLTAAIAANSCFWAMRSNPSATDKVFIDRIKLAFTTIVAFTTAVTAGRRLALYRGSAAAASGGTAVANNAIVKKASAVYANSICDPASGGDMRISTTSALTTTGITFETEPIAIMSLTHVGAVGGFSEVLWQYNACDSQEIILEPGQLLAIRNPAAMDAAGTWQLNVDINWHEAPWYV